VSRVDHSETPDSTDTDTSSTLSRRSLLGLGLACTTLPSVSLNASASTANGTEHVVGDGTVKTGGARMVSIGGNHQVWVKHIAAARTALPVLTLHGGPGFPHFYLECFEDFLPKAGISYWYYDQLGCGFSDIPDDVSLWTIERFTQEIEQVRAALGLERMVLLGHSWGGLQCIEYALRHPERIAGLVISNMTASTASYEKYLGTLRRELSPDKLKRLEDLERAKAYDSPDYEAIVFDDLYHRHVCRLDPWPEPVTRAVKYLSAPVYNAIQGASEFQVTGNMKNWDRWSDLGRIKAPTLLLGGRYDEINPQDMREMAKRMPNAQVVICEKGSHLSMYDDQQAYFSALVPFLTRVTQL
jgi:proline iminopeptidase